MAPPCAAPVTFIHPASRFGRLPWASCHWGGRLLLIYDKGDPSSRLSNPTRLLSETLSIDYVVRVFFFSLGGWRPPWADGSLSGVVCWTRRQNLQCKDFRPVPEWNKREP
jgi:hypothetical protein